MPIKKNNLRKLTSQEKNNNLKKQNNLKYNEKVADFVQNLKHPSFIKKIVNGTVLSVIFDGKARMKFIKSKPFQELLSKTKQNIKKLNEINLSSLTPTQLSKLKKDVLKLMELTKYIEEYSYSEVNTNLIKYKYLNKIEEQEKLNNANLNKQNIKEYSNSDKKAISNLSKEELQEMKVLQKKFAEYDGNLKVIITDVKVLRKLYDIYKKEDYSIFLDMLSMYKRSYITKERKFLEDLKIIDEYLKPFKEKKIPASTVFELNKLSDKYIDYLKIIIKINNKYINYSEEKRTQLVTFCRLAIEIASKNKLKLNSIQTEKVFDSLSKFMNFNNFENSVLYYNIFRETITDYIKKISENNIEYKAKFDRKFEKLDIRLNDLLTYDINKALYFIKAQKNKEIRKFFTTEYARTIYNSNIPNKKEIGNKFQTIIYDENIRLNQLKKIKKKQ